MEPFETFQANMQDARSLLEYAVAFRNQRAKRMRSELRKRVGEALKLSAKQQDQLDCIESDDLFVVFMPGGGLGRDRFDDLRPLLRSSLVAACAALETYVADRTLEFVGPLITKHKMPRGLRDIPLTLGDWTDIETQYQRRGRGIKNIADEHIRELSSTAPNKIGAVLSTIGVSGWVKQVDGARRVRSGRTVKELDEITQRRNLIVHAADRKGRGRAALSPEDVERHLGSIDSIAAGLESVLGAHKV